MMRMRLFDRTADRFEVAHRKGECSWFKFDTRPARDAFFEAFEACRTENDVPNKDLEAMLRFDRKFFLPALLNIDDRICGRYGVESRPALLQQDLVRRISEVPVGSTLGAPLQKPLLQALAANYIPQAIARRSDKMGFTTPIGTFVQQSRKTIRTQLEDSPFRHLYSLPKGPLPVSGKFSREVFGLLMMDLWLNRYAS
jgi:hypothetical protein